ncbi:MAG: DUF5131 family protein [Candidatus Odinarchaeota archaeon]|nr:DUF5131 family protein [Candidatus Odinarchaeota archaeon]
MTKSKMFSFISRTWNPIGGSCIYNCSYCWARKLASKYRIQKYTGTPKLYPKELNKKFVPGEFIFIGDMRDIFSPDVPTEWIFKILDIINKNRQTKFLFLTKNPLRYKQIRSEYGFFPDNVLLGATIESNLDYPDISNAPLQTERLKAMMEVSFYYPDLKLFVSIEPILDFDSSFARLLGLINPSLIAIGYDNYSCRLPEPKLEKTMNLIANLKHLGITIEQKTLRRAWYERRGTTS